MATAKKPGSPAQSAAPATHNNSGRIKYADPRSLPSFPSTGLASDGAAASAAASLGWSNQKTVEFWKPDPSSSASAAAVLAKDYKMSPLWEPSSQSAGHKAAVLAVGSADAALKKSASAAKPSVRQDTWGNSAATQAFRADRPQSSDPVSLAHGSSAATQAFNVQMSQSKKTKHAPSPETARGDKSLVAAKGAMNRPISSLSSTGLRDVQAAEASAAASALNGATLAHRQSMKAKPSVDGAGAVPVTTMTRNMFTANPPVKPEVDERTYNEKIHQSAVEMAKKMYARQQLMVDQTKAAHEGKTEEDGPSPYLNIQDAAYKQAQARLAKLHDEYHQSREYQEYYGADKSPKQNRFSIGSKLRRRSGSDDDMDDRQQSEKIREQMSMFSSKLSQVDKGKRGKDREALLAAAQRNVKAQLHGMDERVYQETGRANPSLITDWEAKAQKAAQSRHESRTENKGKIDIGGGVFMTQEEIDAIATKKIQPVLDDINEKAEAERERLAILKMEEQTRRDEAEKQRVRDKEAKDISKKLKEQEKQEERARKLQEKQEEKAKKEEERAAKAEEKRLAKDEKRKSKLATTAAPVEQEQTHATEPDAADDGDEGRQSEATGEGSDDGEVHEEPDVTPAQPRREASAESPKVSGSKSDASGSPTSKVRGWIKNRFSRGKSVNEQDKKRRSFFGGASPRSAAANDSAASLENRSTSMHDVAHAGKEEENVAASDVQGEADEMDSQGVSPVSTPLEEERELGDAEREDDEVRKDEDDEEQRTSRNAPALAVEESAIRKSSSPMRDSRFREEMDQ